jgi:molybdate transport system substrate-binding protein
VRWGGPFVLALLVSAWVLAGPVPSPCAQDVLLSVAISLKDAVQAVGREFEQAQPGVTLRYNFGGSGELQKQIEAGAPVDAFISAGQPQIDALAARGLLRDGSPRVVARNTLVLVVPADSRLDIRAPAHLLRPEVQRVVIGNPRTVPAGQYAEESLRGLGLWEAVRPKLIFAENVRQAVEYVARGEVDAGLVYATDAGARIGHVKEVGRPPQESYTPVIYPGAVVAGSKQAALAQAFLDLLQGPVGRKVLGRYGFQEP